MKKFRQAMCMFLPLFFLFLVLPDQCLAQGTSPVKVKKIEVNPDSFKVGKILTISVEIQNTSNKRYGCVGGTHYKVFLNIFKATPYHVSNQVWKTSQPLSAILSPGEQKTITFSAKWKVPNIDTDRFIFRAGGPICAPDEFNQTAAITFLRTCVYRLLPKFKLIRKATKKLGK